MENTNKEAQTVQDSCFESLYAKFTAWVTRPFKNLQPTKQLIDGLEDDRRSEQESKQDDDSDDSDATDGDYLVGHCLCKLFPRLGSCNIIANYI
ncbi:hypothetical protein EON65_33155 [archaeon]|nr:MAG: hypothetical protein EON65_33155 [archaeon]